MKTVIFNVGAALSSYVELGNNKIVVDVGKSNDFSMVHDFLIPLFVKRDEFKREDGKYHLDQVFVSHPHLDHMSDLGELDKNFHVELFTTPNDLSKENESYKNVNWDLVDNPDADEIGIVKKMYKTRHLPLRVCDPSRMIMGYHYPGGVEHNSILRSESYTNNIGIVLYIDSGYRIFFAADVQKEGMKRLLMNQPELKKKLGQGVDFLVCPHHGLRSSFSTDLFASMKGGKTRMLNIVSEKVNGDDNRNVDSRYSSAEFCYGDNNLSSPGNPVCQRKTSQGHVYIDDNGNVSVETDIWKIIDKFVSFSENTRK